MGGSSPGRIVALLFVSFVASNLKAWASKVNFLIKEEGRRNFLKTLFPTTGSTRQICKSKQVILSKLINRETQNYQRLKPHLRKLFLHSLVFRFVLIWFDRLYLVVFVEASWIITMESCFIWFCVLILHSFDLICACKVYKWFSVKQSWIFSGWFNFCFRILITIVMRGFIRLHRTLIRYVFVILPLDYFFPWFSHNSFWLFIYDCFSCCI